MMLSLLQNKHKINWLEHRGSKIVSETQVHSNGGVDLEPKSRDSATVFGELYLRDYWVNPRKLDM